ncbi:MAG TPA: hypothetical protein PLQ04_01585 [Lachnospiraceae bacterium]|nr:hypothetical protein [Lachnospiraceae bacterium]
MVRHQHAYNYDNMYDPDAVFIAWMIGFLINNYPNRKQSVTEGNNEKSIRILLWLRMIQ